MAFRRSAGRWARTISPAIETCGSGGTSHAAGRARTGIRLRRGPARSLPPAFVIPTQAGTQLLLWRVLRGGNCDGEHWAPACAGVTSVRGWEGVSPDAPSSDSNPY